MNLAESLLSALRDHGAREIFGIPGDFALPFFKVIETSNILPLYTLSHEPGVGFAADAAARIRSAPSVAAVTYGAGALNMVNAVASAYAEKAPVVVVSGAPGRAESSRGLLLHHQVKSLDSQHQIYREITCDQARLDDLRTAPEAIARVLHNCVTQSRPVYFEIPRNLVAEPCAAVTRLPADPVDVEAVETCVGEVLDRLQQAASPVLMVGVEIRRFGLEQKIELLAQRLDIPVMTSFLGRGLLAHSTAQVLGTYMGITGGARLLCNDGLWRARWPGSPGCHRASADYPCRRWRVSDDRLGTGQLSALWLGPDCVIVQQPQLGNVARLSARERFQQLG